jgi:hypothetical protein
MATKSEVLRRWHLLSPYLDRWERILWAATEAEVIGRGGAAMLAELTGVSNPTISARIQRIRLTKDASPWSLANSAPRVQAG